VEQLEARQLLSAAPLITGGDDPETFDSLGYLPPQQTLFNASGLLSPAAPGKPLVVARQFLKQNAGELGLGPADLANVAVTDQYTDADTGTTHIYLRQKLNGLQIVNANLSIHLTRDNRVIFVGGGFVAGAGSPQFAAAQPGAARPVRSAATAVRDAAGYYRLLADGSVKQVRGRDTADIERKQLLRLPGASLDDIPARLQYVAGPDGLSLAWDVVLRTPGEGHWLNASVDASTGRVLSSSDWVSHASYNVYALPSEGPHDGPSNAGQRTVVVDPHDPTVSPFGWHDTNGVAGAESTLTTGNNVNAYLDRDDSNTPDANGRPDGGASLAFNYPLDLTVAPTTASNQQAATTNLFYLNNVLHDVHARYGFTEAAGNFQVRNYGGQGFGNDAVNAEAQDGGGTNNANMSTPPDGSRPRMQMYLFNRTTPSRDGDLDNQIVIHEYGHGVSNRLTGGPSNANALVTDQSGGMGEGWGDWWALMLTMKPADGQFGRYPMGTYVNGQDRVTGAGIRRFPYSFDMSVDPLTFSYYNNDALKQVHRTGEIWCSALWDMTWLLINKHGYSADISQGYNPSIEGRNGGNNLALKLVMDGLKLQPANPSFTQARNAILAADNALTGGANRFEIWQAFARRGLGYSASTASSSSGTVTVATDLPPDATPPAPATPDLAAAADTGALAADNLTRHNNATPAASLQFTVDGTVVGATVTILADGVPVGSAVATSTQTLVTTNGAALLADGTRAITARQRANGIDSTTSAPLSIVIDTTGPRITQWQSAATHDRGVGLAGLTIPADGSFVEPRVAGVRTLLLALTESADTTALAVGLWGTAASGQPLDLSTATASPAYAVGSNTLLSLTFGQSLPDFARYLVRVGGLTDAAGNPQVIDADASRTLLALSGDITGDGRTNNTDVGAAISMRGLDPISAALESHLRADLTLDGRTNNTDVGAAISMRGKDGRELAAPTGN